MQKMHNGVHDVRSSGQPVISQGMDRILVTGVRWNFHYLGDMIGVGGGAEDA